MKMSELRAENESLKKQIELLSEQKDSGKDTAEVNQLKEKVKSAKKSIKDLKAEKAVLSGRIQGLENDKSAREQDNQQLKVDIEHIQQQLTELSDVHGKTITEVEGLRVEQQALQEKAAQLQMVLPEVDRLRQVENICNEKSAQVVSLQADLEQQRQLLADVRDKASKEAGELQNQNARLSNEMEMVRNRLTAELETQREQSGTEIASLQAQKNSLSNQVAELTEKLKIVAKHLERQLSEKRKIASQYDTTVKESQAVKAKSEKDVNNLMALLQKMAAELDASKATHPSQPNQPGTPTKVKPANLGDTSPIAKPPQQELVELRNQVSMLNEINASQNRELTVISKRMERINKVLATPRGRLFSQLFGLKD